MSDIAIPGVSSKYNSQNIVKDLMEVERIPLERMEDSVTSFRSQKQVWQEVNRSLSRFQDSSKSLFGFDNPFNERRALSSDEESLTLTATRQAAEGNNSIVIDEVAKADRFLSESLPKDFKPNAGTYRFIVGEEEVSFKFGGGSLEAFSNALNRKIGDTVSSKVIKNTSDTQVILIEAKKVGRDNRLVFLDEARDLGVRAGIFDEISDRSRSPRLTQENINAWLGSSPNNAVALQNETLILTTNGSIRIPIDPALRVKENMVLELELNTVFREEEEYLPPSPPPGPDVPKSGGITFQGIEIENSKSEPIMPTWRPPPPPEIVEDFGIFSVQQRGNRVPLEPISPTTGFDRVTLPLSDIVTEISALFIENKNTLWDIQVRDIRIYDPTSRGDIIPRKPLSVASDAMLTVDGVEVQRSSNTLADLIPGVTLELKKPSDGPIEVTVESDTDAVKDGIISFVGNYNRLLTDINVLTRNDESIIEEVEFFTDKEREEAYERLGSMQGDITLNQLKSNLQRLIMDSYETRSGRELSLLAQIGISTNANRPGTGTFDITRLRGYLEIDEERLDQTISQNLLSIKDLFGSDSDGDLVVDRGLAFAIDRYVRPYIQTGGILAFKIGNIDSQIQRTNREIDDYNDYLQRYEQQLKTRYGRMEAALDTLEQSSQTIQNFSNANNENR